MTQFNIYITGVGGQGIGLLSQALLRGIDHAGIRAVAVDTHGLAQRGGIVVSRIRCGTHIHSPLIMGGQADLVLGMEVHEAMRGVGSALKPSGTLVYLDVSWQPLPVRLGQTRAITSQDIETLCRDRNVTCFKVTSNRIPDAKMQNMALLGTVAKHSLVPGVDRDCYQRALEDLLQGSMLSGNLDLFREYAG
ncbi:MAG: 2-oxoacid:acceptor oxidoreductase family protein [Pseudomonadota bacterium]